MALLMLVGPKLLRHGNDRIVLSKCYEGKLWCMLLRSCLILGNANDRMTPDNPSEKSTIRQFVGLIYFSR